MTYTSKPCLPGFYWIRKGKVQSIARVLPGCLNALTLGRDGIKPLKDESFEGVMWRGPIRPPKE